MKSSSAHPFPAPTLAASALCGQAALKWIVLVALVVLGGATALLYSKSQKQQAELQQARAELAELEQLRQQTAELEQLRATARQVDRLKKDKEELVRLRGEVAALRPLKQEVQKLQAQNQQLSHSVQNLQHQSSELTAMKTQNQQLQGILQQQESQAQAAACIANLKTIAGAKQVWAQEFQKAPTDLPADADLFGADRYIRAKPECPAGGVYTLGTVNQKPVCSIPGHTF